jgi:hypothetical protein
VCCLDTGLSRRLREQFPTRASLERPETIEFLETLFSRCTMASTYCERLFAGMSAATRDKSLSQPAFAARAVLEGFQAEVRRHQEQAGAGVGQAGNKRPPWMRTVLLGSRLNACQAFQKDFHSRNPGATLPQSREAWQNLDQAERQRWAVRAQGRRAASREVAAPLAAALAEQDKSARESSVAGGPCAED